MLSAFVYRDVRFVNHFSNGTLVYLGYIPFYDEWNNLFQNFHC